MEALLELVASVAREGGKHGGPLTAEFMDDDPATNLVVFRDSKENVVMIMNAQDYLAFREKHA